MALGGIYETGTVTIGGDRVSVTGVGTLWSPIVEIGDWLFIGGQVGLVGAVVDDTHLTLETQWIGTLPSAATYSIIKMSWLRYDPALTQAKLRQLLEAIAAQGFFYFTPVAPPDPAVGEDGQWALKTDEQPWRIWHKEGGVWVEQPPNTASMPQGTAGFHFEASGIGVASAFKGFTQAGSGAIARTWPNKLGDLVSVLDFGADRTGAVDSTAAFQNALNAHKGVYAPAGTYKIDGTIVILAFCSLRGEFRGNTKLIASTANLPLIRFPSGVPYARLSNLTLDRAVTATSGGDGVVFVDGGSNNVIEDLDVFRQWRGMALGSTDASWAQHITISSCRSHGLFMTNAASQAATQWQLHDIYATNNVGSGFLLASTEGASGMICGKMSNLQTFANSGRGFYAVGTATAPVYNIRVANAHFGSDGNAGITLNTYGGGHVFTELVMEYAGTYPTGPGNATPATNSAFGIDLTANNTDCRINGVHIFGSADAGINSSCGRLFVSNGFIVDNGANGGSVRFGIIWSAGKVYLSNLVITNFAAGGQTYGLVAGTDALIMVGCDLTGNITGPIYEAVVLGNSHIVACFPTSLSSMHPNAIKGFTVGGITVGPATGGNLGAGTVNVAAGMFKNNSPYVPALERERAETQPRSEPEPRE